MKNKNTIKILEINYIKVYYNNYQIYFFIYSYKYNIKFYIFSIYFTFLRYNNIYLLFFTKNISNLIILVFNNKLFFL